MWRIGRLLLAGLAPAACAASWPGIARGELQQMIDQAGRAHLARLVVDPPHPGAAWVVTAPLRVPPGLALVASGAGTLITAADDPDKPYRTRPVFLLAGSPEQPVSGVTLDGFRLRGRFGDAPIVLRNVRDIRLLGIDIAGSRGKAVAVENGSGIVIARLTARFERAPVSPGAVSPPAEGGAGIWCFGCSGSRVEDSMLDATPFWQPGPAWDSGNAAVCAPGLARPGCTLTRERNGLARALDLVAFYGGAGNAILRNRLSAGNAAAIYVNLCRAPAAGVPARSLGLRVEGNVIADMREHGIDVVAADAPVIARNDIRRVGGAAIALAETAQATIEGNVMEAVAQAWRPATAATPPAALRLLRGSRGIRIRDNTQAGRTPTVYVSPDSAVGSP